jgi:thioredoxin reductase
MKAFHILICLALVVALVLLAPRDLETFGGLSWLGWVSMTALILLVGFIVVVNDSVRAAAFFKKGGERASLPEKVRTLTRDELAELKLDKYRGPAYPHPVIFPERCIGCQACVEACPHDVLEIVDGVAAAVAPDLCMEDTACQAECPVNPKACIVINTSKPVVSRPAPTRDGATYQTNVPGCYIIGDVSGVPLIKNAVKEGAEVISHIAAELESAEPEKRAEYDVAIIGVGPGGASAAAAAQELGLRYIAIEQGKTLSTIDLYPKGKYIFFKPDTKDWFGGIPAAGLGLASSKYGSEEPAGDDNVILASVGIPLIELIRGQVAILHNRLIDRIPHSLHKDLSQPLDEKIERELKKSVVQHLRSRGGGDWAAIYQQDFTPRAEKLLAEIRDEIFTQLVAKIPGDQRENILAVWLSSLADRGVHINEYESCKTATRAEDGDYFVVNTEKGSGKVPHRYTARRIIVAIGLRGAPNKLRLPNEDLKFKIEGREEQKVVYGLSNPDAFWGLRIVVVGGGNVAVEAAVDLVATRDGTDITPRPADKINRVTMLVRDYLAPTVKFGNKVQLYRCVEDGLIDLRFGVGIKEMHEHELVLEYVNTGEIVETIPNDYVFALIGGERPDRFLQSIGITLS